MGTHARRGGWGVEEKLGGGVLRLMGGQTGERERSLLTTSKIPEGMLILKIDYQGGCLFKN